MRARIEDLPRWEWTVTYVSRRGRTCVGVGGCHAPDIATARELAEATARRDYDLARLLTVSVAPFQARSIGHTFVSADEFDDMMAGSAKLGPRIV